MIVKRLLPHYRYLSGGRKLYSKIPTTPKVIPINNLKDNVVINQETVDHLERIALVDLGNRRGLNRLQSAIEFANQIIGIDTKNVKPMISVLENRLIFLREDKIDDGDCREDVMANATVKEEEYFVAPPGNIPLIPRRPIVEDNRESLMSSLINKIIQLCGKHYFLQPLAVGSGEIDIYKYKHGPTGELLRNNIYGEWFLSNAINTEECMLPYSDLGDITTSFEAIGDSFLHAKQLLCQKLPFGLCGSQMECRNEDNEETSHKSSYFNPVKYTALRTYLFLYPENSYQHFNSWQQKRKHWWRKFSGSPGRYTLTDVRSLPQGDTVMVKAEFPWGAEILETISLRGTKPFEGLDNASRAQFEIKHGRHSVLPHVIESVLTLDRAMLAFLCDAYKEQSDLKRSTSAKERPASHPILCLHRRLAPYKVSFSASSSNAPVAEDLCALALLLTLQLRRNGISTLLLPDLAETSLEVQHMRNDEMGTPYTVVMNESTLKNGIIGLRSRDTTLKEQLHITDLNLHMRRLLKNY